MPSTPLDSVLQSLSSIAPTRMAESWDNVGLLVGDRKRSITSVMTCLTITPTVVQEAIDKQAGLIVTHHPLPFRPLSKITTDSIPGEMLWQLIGASVAIYSAHTAFDSASEGVNESWARSLNLDQIRPLNDPTPENELGSGRYGTLGKSQTVRDIILQCADFSGANGSIRGVGDLDQEISKVGFACGSGGSFVPAAIKRGCQLLITGEATFHDCLAAESGGIALGLLGHYHSERFAMNALATELQSQWPDLTIWASTSETDPVQVIR